MINYETLCQARQQAFRLREQLLSQISQGHCPYNGRIPREDELEMLLERWLPAKTLQKGIIPNQRSYSALTRHRLTSDYWRDHCFAVGQMMRLLAKALGQDEQLWRATGIVHDLDFIMYPNFDDSVSPDKAHPTAICTELIAMKLPPVAVLAILEHSPHLKQPASSPLSHALILCDEHATMTGAG